jgi:D-beta-D-heptose 7-phosphate kinase/D-beta-D-heptose 1-phosphate adenosyltransferase
MYPQPPISALPGDHDRANRFFELVDAMANRRVAVVGDAGGIVDAVAALGGDVLQTLSGCDAVVVSDDGSGSATPALARTVKEQLDARGRRRPTPVVISARHRLLDYRGFTGCAPTETDVERLLGATIGDEAALERAGRDLLRQLQMAAVLVRRGSRGMTLFERECETVQLPLSCAIETSEDSGDVVLAAWTLALAAGASMYEASRLANYAGGFALGPGSAAVPAAAWRDAVEADHDLPEVT